MHAVPDREKIEDMFALVPDNTVRFVRLSLPDRVAGPQIRNAVNYLNKHLVRLRQSKGWNDCVLSSAGVIHRRWKVESSRHGRAGFWIHTHLLLNCDSEPDFDRIADKFRRDLMVPAGRRRADYFDVVPLNENVPRTATYMTHVKHLVPGYHRWTEDADDPDGRLDMERMPVPDILHFGDSMHRARRLLRHGVPALAGQARTGRSDR